MITEIDNYANSCVKYAFKKVIYELLKELEKANIEINNHIDLCDYKEFVAYKDGILRSLEIVEGYINE